MEDLVWILNKFEILSLTGYEDYKDHDMWMRNCYFYVQNPANSM